MKRRVGYLSALVLAAALAVITQFSFATAQRPSGGHPTPECEACAQACRVEFEACKASGRPFGQCASEQQQCGAACRRPGGACNPQTGDDTKGR
jgi:hypothetical protein